MCLTISYLIFSAGEVSFFIASHLKTSRKLAVNLNDIKKNFMGQIHVVGHSN
jgi:hypothetical protein